MKKVSREVCGDSQARQEAKLDLFIQDRNETSNAFYFRRRQETKGHKSSYGPCTPPSENHKEQKDHARDEDTPYLVA